MPHATRRSLTTSLLALAILAFVALGCGDLAERLSGSENANSGNTAVPETTAAPEAKTGPMDAGLCANEYYPIEPGVQREYRITGDAPANYVLSQEPAGEDGFAEIRSFGSGLTVRNNWICTPEGLRTAEYRNAMSMANGDFEMNTLKSSGVTLPKVWEQGKEFEANYTVNASIKAGPVSAAADGTVLLKNRVASMNEKVTAGGKEYDAARVDTTIEITLSMGGQSIPKTTVTTKNWYAKRRARETGNGRTVWPASS
jgi:hypothetical protein